MNDKKEEIETFHFVNHSSYSITYPLVTEDLQQIYGLSSLASRVARVDEFGNKKKMRQSYKGHIQEFPGKNVILKDRFIRDLIFGPKEGKTERFIEDLDPELIEVAFNLYPGPIPGFDSSVFGSSNTEKKSELYSEKDVEILAPLEKNKHHSKKKKRKHDDYEQSVGLEQKKYKKTN
ncbi:hypothetical protein T552_01837 [Pneumocystis carinii B80]|uniref:Mediator of RNA polymerase II transcription subunit 19 n=1 Tax=Pneumocystis carinii (strain B80) TaxID=1408658 RepID=A0A0W4ZJN6_PNEC8|nr:hypothetical protein T552_01837 [Pneumocystis carinii B80]KTW28576.1 hypothetical protein T552_01837 [Pneumocystis carinii B80]